MIVNYELEQKMATLRAMSAAVERARELRDKNPNHRNAVLFQRAVRQFNELRSTLPKLRLVA